MIIVCPGCKARYKFDEGKLGLDQPLHEVLPEFKRPETTHGLVAPTGTPRPILMELNKQIARILALPDVKERLNNISYVISTSTPEEYDKILRSQIEGLATLVRAAGLKPK